MHSFSTVLPVVPLTLWFVLFCLKHVLADYPLQSSWMALGKERAVGWLWPLVSHCLVHGLLTTVLMLLLSPRLWFLGFVDFALHLGIDRAKGFINAHWHLGPQDRPFWLAFGIDQTLHHLTGFALAVVIAAWG